MTERDEVRQHKQSIRLFMREHYSDERLAMLLAHAQSGRLAYNSCCCFVGVANAPHALCGFGERGEGDSTHHRTMQQSVGKLAWDAEHAFNHLASRTQNLDEQCNRGDDVRRRVLIPMIRAEIKRRDNLRRDEIRQFNGDTITQLCKLGDEILAAYLPKDWTKERWIRAMAEHREEGCE